MVTFVHRSVGYITCNLGTTISNGSSCVSYTDKSKGPEQLKPVWQVPSKKVRKIFQRYYKGQKSDRRPKNRTEKALWQEGTPTWPPESHRRKRTYVTKLGTKERESVRHIKPGRPILPG